MRRPARDFYRAVIEGKAQAGARDAIWLTALEWFAVYAGALGQRGEALASIREAVAIYRKLAEGNADAFLPDLATSCGAWGQILAEGAPAEAADRFGDGVGIIAPFAKKLPQAYLPLALALAGGYVGACAAASIDPDAEIARQIEVLRDLENRDA